MSHPPEQAAISRRTLLKAGLAGGAALFVARWLHDRAQDEAIATPADALDSSARSIVEAIVPVLLAGALPTTVADPKLVTQRVADIVDHVDRAVAGLPSASRKEVDQLFALLAFAPARCLLAGVWTPWPDASVDSISGFLAAWRDSRFALQRSAYGALHQLVMAAWYGDPSAWPAIGYAGPPSLASS
ncbi:MAG TPA: hypothetical protein VGH59_00940 [Casimicrobiaceae bacterium]|jgi:hypothetical protein